LYVFARKYLSRLGNSYVFWPFYVFNFRILKNAYLNGLKDLAIMYLVEEWYLTAKYKNKDHYSFFIDTSKE
tara:strand:- start:209 stop:421 length:213 start_codon:yes stop_codon:yes gene_type:complete